MDVERSQKELAVGSRSKAVHSYLLLVDSAVM